MPSDDPPVPRKSKNNPDPPAGAPEATPTGVVPETPEASGIAAPPENPRVVRVAVYDARTGAELVAVSGPPAEFSGGKDRGTWRVTSRHLFPLREGNRVRVTGPDRQTWEATDVKADGETVVLKCTRVVPGGDQ